MRWMTVSILSLCVGLFSRTAAAQDPVKLSPSLYKVVLENDQVRVLEYNVKPGDKEPMHSHPAAVVYVFNDGKAIARTPDGKSQVIESKAGQTIWSEPVTHTWEYQGPGNSRVLIVELKHAAPTRTPPKRP